MGRDFGVDTKFGWRKTGFLGGWGPSIVSGDHCFLRLFDLGFAAMVDGIRDALWERFGFEIPWATDG
ncbi:MAG: hypothetical protein ABI693_07245 [Bryobacteraceae bacterium]